MKLVGSSRPLFLAFAGLLIPFGGLLATEKSFSYSGRDLPEEAVPRWALVQRGGRAEVQDGRLRVDVGSGERRLYGIGRWYNQAEGTWLEWGEAEAWEMKDGNVRLEIRFRCEAEDPEMEVFRILIRDGSHSWQLPFSCTRVGNADVDTTEWDTYHVVIEQGFLRLTSERQGLILEDRKGSPDQRANGLIFGAYYFAKDGSMQPRSWEVEYIRWSTPEDQKKSDK